MERTISIGSKELAQIVASHLFATGKIGNDDWISEVTHRRSTLSGTIVSTFKIGND